MTASRLLAFVYPQLCGRTAPRSVGPNTTRVHLRRLGAAIYPLMHKSDVAFLVVTADLDTLTSPASVPPHGLDPDSSQHGDVVVWCVGVCFRVLLCCSVA